MKSRLRRITIGARTYAWTVHITGGHAGYGLELRVWGAGKNSRQLRARLREFPRPGEVEQMISYGLEQGWDPDGRGPLFDAGKWDYVTTGSGSPRLVRTA
jgi:hypothetical protein